MAQQFWDENSYRDLKSTPSDPSPVDYTDHYVDTVPFIVETYGLDGYDLDYEKGNDVAEAPAILSKIRTKLDALSKKVGKPLDLSITPAWT